MKLLWVLPLLFIGVAWLWAYGSSGHKTQTQSALMVDGDNIYSQFKTLPRKSSMKNSTRGSCQQNRILLERKGTLQYTYKKTNI